MGNINNSTRERDIVFPLGTGKRAARAVCREHA
jgi:hypothetical protein